MPSSRLFKPIEIPEVSLIWFDSSLGNRKHLVRDNQVGVYLQFESEASTDGASAMRAVKAECPRLDFSHADLALDAGKMFGEKQFIAIDDRDKYHSGSQIQGGFYRIGEPALAVALPDDQAVDHYLDVMLLVFVELYLVG